MKKFPHCWYGGSFSILGERSKLVRISPQRPIKSKALTLVLKAKRVEEAAEKSLAKERLVYEVSRKKLSPLTLQCKVKLGVLM